MAEAGVQSVEYQRFIQVSFISLFVQIACELPVYQIGLYLSKRSR